MFRNIILFLSFLLLFQTARAQQSKRANVWYFGYGAGIDFNGDKPVALNDSQMNQWEGTASICDENGKLLLYTNGIQIWNNRHNVISGDTNLGGNDSSTQSAIILPMPGNPNIYYVFTTSTHLTVIVIDITLNQGEGGIVSKTVLMQHSTEKLTAIQHCNGKDFWVLAHELGNNIFRSYLLTKEGLNKSYIENKIGNDVPMPLGYLKFSPSGTRLATALWSKSIFELYDFDNSSGLISNPVAISHPDFLRAYGLEFSPDESFLYVTETLNTATRIFQLDISGNSPAEILKSKLTIGQTGKSYFGALKMGPDNKIYVAKNRTTSLGVINSPNTRGLSCDYVSEGFELGSSVCGIGLPNFISTFNLQQPELSVIVERNCTYVTLIASYHPISSNISYQWYNGKSAIISANNPTYTVKRSGDYSVVVSSKCADENLLSPKIDLKILEAEPAAVKISCGFYKLIANANANFLWTGEGIDLAKQSSDSIIVTGFGKKTFYLKVFDEEDPTCFVEKQLKVDFGTCDARVFIPNIFTPNQDGINDTFKIVIIEGNAIRLDIYDRWGSLIFTDINATPEWNGKADSGESINGEYVYIFKYRTEMGQEYVKKGSILLQR